MCPLQISQARNYRAYCWTPAHPRWRSFATGTLITKTGFTFQQLPGRWRTRAGAVSGTGMLNMDIFCLQQPFTQAAVRNNNCIQAVQATGIPPQTLYKQLNGVLASGLHCISALAFVGLTSMAMERARAASDMAIIMKRCHSQSCAGVLSCPAKPYHTLNCNALPVLFESLISMQLMAA